MVSAAYFPIFPLFIAETEIDWRSFCLKSECCKSKMKQICVSSCTTNLTTGLNVQAFSFWLVFVISRFVDFSLYANYVLFTS